MHRGAQSSAVIPPLRSLHATLDSAGQAENRAPELLAKLCKIPERAFDLAPKISARLSASLWRHYLPEHRVVPVSPSVVPNHGADSFGSFVDVAHQVIDGFLRQLGRFLESPVEIVHVCLMVLSVMDLHCFRIYVWLERREVIGKRGKCECHCLSPV